MPELRLCMECQLRLRAGQPMKFGMRKPSIKRSIKARTTGKLE